MAAQSTSDAAIGPADIGGFEEGEFEGDSPTEEVAAQIRLRRADPIQLRAQEIEFRQLLRRCRLARRARARARHRRIARRQMHRAPPVAGGPRVRIPVPPAASLSQRALSSGFDPVVAGLVGSQHRSDHYGNVLFTTTRKVSGPGFLILWQYKLPTRTGWHDQFPPARSRLCEKRSRCLERSVATRTPRS